MTASAPPSPPARGRPFENTDALLSRLGDASLWHLEVVEATALTPSMRRIRFSAPGLSDLRYQPGQDLMFEVPDIGTGRYRRRYTIRGADRHAGTIDVDIVLHGDGPGAAWAASASPGDRIEAIGPRGKITVDLEAAWHLFVGDDAAVPASLAMAETLAADAVTVVLEVDGPEDEQQATSADGAPVPIRWLHRRGADPASAEQLVAALERQPLPDGVGHAYIAGELRVVNALAAVLRDRGMDPERISSKPYWRAGVANAPHGEPIKS